LTSQKKINHHASKWQKAGPAIVFIHLEGEAGMNFIF